MFNLSAHCWICQLPLVMPTQGICSFCSAACLLKPRVCPCCGLPSEHTTRACGRCIQKAPYWQQLIFVSDYQPPLRQLVHRLKYQGKWQIASALSRLMLLSYLYARRTRQLPKPDLITVVPLHHQRQWRRGFNQSDRLARPLARWLECAYFPDVITRTRKTKPQQSLNAIQRRRNLRNAFSCQQNLSGKHVLVVDDVLTTGSTMGEVSRLLLAQGAKSIQVVCLCRTL